MASSGWSTQLAVLLFPGGLCALGLLLLGIVWSQWKRRPILKRRLLLTTLAGGALYLVALVGAGLVSTPVTLAAGMVSRLLVGHERSPFHAPVILPLPVAG